MPVTREQLNPAPNHACHCFINRLQGRCQKIDLRNNPDKCEVWQHWFNSAYKTTNVRSKGFESALNENTKKEIGNLFREQMKGLKTLDANKFEKDHKKWIHKLNTTVSKNEPEVFWAETHNGEKIIGRSQKWINIFLKYYFARYYAKIDSDWMKYNDWIERLAPCFKAPVDFGTIKHASKLWKSPHEENPFVKKLSNRQNQYLAWTKNLNCKNYDKLQSLLKTEAHSEFGQKFGALAYETVYVW